MISYKRTILLGLAIAITWLVTGIWVLSEKKLHRLVQEGSALRAKRSRPVSFRNGIVVLLWTTPKLSLKDDVMSELLWLSTVKNAELYVEELERNAKAQHTGLNIFPIGPQTRAHIGFEFSDTEDVDELLTRGMQTSKRIFAQHDPAAKFAVYVVKRSVYTDYGEYDGPAKVGWDPKQGRNWPTRERSPYFMVHSVFPKPARFANMSNLDWAQNMYWNVQSPMSEMIQPRPRYIRNVVLASTSSSDSAAAPEYASIVIELWPSLEHMNNVFLFFAADNAWDLCINIAVMIRSVMMYADFTAIQQCVLSEYLLL